MRQKFERNSRLVQINRGKLENNWGIFDENVKIFEKCFREIFEEKSLK